MAVVGRRTARPKTQHRCALEIRDSFRCREGWHVKAQIFWLKTRARWKEAPVEHQHSARVDLTKLTDEELERMIVETNEKIERLSPTPRPAKPVLQLSAETIPDAH